MILIKRNLLRYKILLQLYSDFFYYGYEKCIDIELIRINILLELYQALLNTKNYNEIEKQEYEIIGCNRSKVIAALYYLDDRGLIGVRSGKNDNTLRVFIKARGIDDIEDRLNKGLIFLHSDFTCPVLRLYEEKPNN